MTFNIDLPYNISSKCHVVWKIKRADDERDMVRHSLLANEVEITKKLVYHAQTNTKL
jgi:hypothetical protein